MITPRALVIVLAVLGTGSLGPAVVRAASDPGGDQGVVAGLISSLLSSRDTTVSIGAVEGVLSSDTTVRDITISDSQGQWFHLDHVRLVWNRGALFSRRLEVDTLDIGKVEIARRPVATESAAPVTSTTPPEPILPELPLKLVVKAFSLAELDLGEPVVGAAARLTASGNAVLGKPSEGLRLTLESRRLDTSGRLAMRLSFVPETEALEISTSLEEPPGGLLAKVAKLPGEPAVRFDLAGSGPLDAFTARLTLAADPVIGATGTADLHREGTVRRLLLALDTHLTGVLPPPVAALFPGATQLTGDLRFADDGAVDLSHLTLTAPGAHLEAVGRIDPQAHVDLHVTADSRPPTPTEPAPANGYGRLAFDGTVTGPLTGPRVAATLTVEQARLPQGRCGTLALSVSATPDGDLANPATRIAVVADGSASGVAPADPALASALGDRLGLALKGTLTPDGNGDYQLLRAKGTSVDLHYQGQLGPSHLKGQMTADVPDLSRFAALTGQPLRGAVSATLALDGVPGDRIGDATVTAHATGLATGLAAVDGVLGDDVTASGTARLLPDQGFGFETLTIKGRYGSAVVDGTATAGKAGVTARLTMPDLARADRRLSGAGEAVAMLLGSLSHPDLTTHLALINGRMLGRPVPRLALDVEAHDLTGAVNATVTLAGEIDRKPATGTLRVLRRPDGALALEGLDAAIGSVKAKGAVAVAPDGRATGALAVTARTLDDLSPLVLTRLAGSLAVNLTLAMDGGRQVVRVKAGGSGLRVADLALARFDGQGEITDPLGRPVVTAAVTADGLVAAGERVSALRLTAAGGAAATDLTVSARVREIDVDARGRLLTGEALRLELAAASARRGSHRVALAGPASLTLADGSLDIRGLAVLVDGGRVGVQGKAGSRLDLTVAATGVPLAAAGLVVPNLDMSGTLDGDATLSGPVAAPEGHYRLALKQVTAAPLRASGVPLLDLNATGALRGQTVGVDATVAAGRDTSVQAHGTVPLTPQGALDLTVRGKLDAGLANATLAAGGRRLTGTVVVDLRAAGPLTRPDWSGTAVLTGGSYRDTLEGVRLGALQARLAARGSALTLDEASATTGNGGTLSAHGDVRLDADAGFPGTFHLDGRRAELIANGTTTAVADLALDLTGPLARQPRLSGHIETVSVDVQVPARLPTTLKPLEGTRHLHATGAAAARLAERQTKAEESQARRQHAATAVKVTLDIAVSSPGRVFVRGRGLDAELGGDLTITGTSDAPRVVGAYSSRQGHFDALGTRLEFSRGRLAFSGDLMPQLDFLAESTTKDITVQVAVTGPATQPAFAFTSQPALPEDEVLSRLLFAKTSGDLSPFQALHLAQVLTEFSNGGDDDTFDRLRRFLGVDTLDLQTNTGGASVAVSRAISDRISLGVKAGSTPEQSGLSATIDLTHRLRLKNEIDSRGTNAMGLGAEWDY